MLKEMRRLEKERPGARGRSRESTVCLKPNAYGLPDTEANQPPPIALSEAQMCASLAASYPLPPAELAGFTQFG
jgi:hypothetical protein